MTRCHSCGHGDTPTLGFIVLLIGMAIVVGVMFIYATVLKPMSESKCREVFYAVHVADSAGMKPVHYVVRHKLKGGTLAELPTLYAVCVYPDGKVEDRGIRYQQWWKK